MGPVEATLIGGATERDWPLLLPRSGGASLNISSWTQSYGYSPPSAGPAGGDPTHYLHIPMSSGKWYWEVKYTSNYILMGITTSLTHTAYGGGGQDGVVYSSGWGKYGGLVSWVGGDTLVGPAVNDTIGFAYDADTRVLKIYVENALVKTTSAVPGIADVYPLIAFQGGDAEIKFRNNCEFSPPAGYEYY